MANKYYVQQQLFFQPIEIPLQCFKICVHGYTGWAFVQAQCPFPSRSCFCHFWSFLLCKQFVVQILLPNPNIRAAKPLNSRKRQRYTCHRFVGDGFENKSNQLRFPLLEIGTQKLTKAPSLSIQIILLMLRSLAWKYTIYKVSNVATH